MEKNQIGKKGSHVGVVLSFVIFITFLIFIYAVTNPLINSNEKTNLISQIKTNVLENISAEMRTISVSVSQGVNSECVELENFITNTEVGSNLVVQNENQIAVNSQISTQGEDLDIEKGVGSIFIKVFESEVFPQIVTGSLTPCQPLIESNYDLGLIRTGSYIFESRITEFINAYNNDYESLKSSLKIPAGSELLFTFTDNEGTILTAQSLSIPQSVSVYSDAFSVQYINQNAQTETGSITITVW